MSVAIRLTEKRWYLVSVETCEFQIEGKNVPVWFAESATEPASAPDGNQPGTVEYKTLVGGQIYEFRQVDAVRLWAYPTNNGATIIVDSRAGFPIAQQIQFGALTAFGEMKVAEYDAVGAWTFPYNVNSRLIRSTTVATGSVSQSGSFAVLQTGTATDGEATIETRRAVRYPPGQGGLVRFTAIYNSPAADSQQEVGLGDALDGLFFGYVGEQFGIIRRNNGVDFFTPQSEWNGQPFDEINPQLLNVYQIQYQWLGAGEIRFYVEFPNFGGFVLVHRIIYANTDTDVSFQNPSLPLRASIRNDGNATNLELRTPSGTAGVEGDSADRSQRALFGAEAGAGNVTSQEPILSVRNPLTYQGKANRLTLRINFIKTGAAGTNNRVVVFRVYLNATLSGASFSPISANETPAERDNSAVSRSGGQLIASTQVPFNGVDTIDFSGSVEFFVVPGETVTVTAASSQSVDVGVSINFDSEV